MRLLDLTNFSKIVIVFKKPESISYIFNFPVLNILVIYLIFSLLTACVGKDEYNDDFAINAINVSNKSQYRTLSENKNREPISFEVVENVAYMQGVMDSTIPHLISNLISHYPEVDTIVMTKVFGTIDFSATLEAGRLLRDACLTTVVPSYGKITSGGVHFFMSGCKRVVEFGGKLGIHTWKYATYDAAGEITGGMTAMDFPKGSPEHNIYLDYQATMGIPESYYWFMANTPFENMYFLRPSEIVEFNMTTSTSKSWGANYRLAIAYEKPPNIVAAKFFVDNNVAIMHGKISYQTSNDLLNMLQDNPGVHTVEFGFVPGIISSHINDAIALGYAIREAGLKTKIGKNSYIFGGAAHAFIAGHELEFDPDGQLGVGSWVDDELISRNLSLTEIEIAHSDSLAYYDEMGISQSFYYYQLDIPGSQQKFINAQDLVELGIHLR